MKSLEQKAIENKSIVTGKELEAAGYVHLTDNHDRVVFGKGYERRMYQRLKGKTERYKFLKKYESVIRDLK